MSKNPTFCKEWATTDEVSQLPSDQFLTGYMVVLSVAGLISLVLVKSLRPADISRLLQEGGVALNKIAHTAKEIERKVFHLCGLLVPLIYQALLHHDVSRQFCIRICWTVTVLGVAGDLLRVHVPWVKANWPLKSILREAEQDQLCGGTYFAIGCTLAIHLFHPVIAMTSIIFLVLGDMAAALIGRSFGQSVCSMKVGPGGKKSVEGSFGMFAVCVLFGCTIFTHVHLREYAVVIGALTATLVERSHSASTTTSASRS